MIHNTPDPLSLRDLAIKRIGLVYSRMIFGVLFSGTLYSLLSRLKKS